jgi:hypothetical protein
MEVFPDQSVPRRRRSGDAALDLWIVDTIGQGGKRVRIGVGRLPVDGGPVDRAPVQARRCSGLEPAKLESEPFQRCGQPERGRLAHPSGRDLALADMDQATQKSAGRKHDRARLEDAAIGQNHGRDLPIGYRQSGHLSLDEREVADRPQFTLHGASVELPVGLRSRATNGGSLSPVEKTKLDTGLVRHPAHDAVEGVDLSDQMALAEAADGWIARHGSDRVQPLGHKRDLGAEARGGGRSLRAGVTAADHDHVEGVDHCHPARLAVFGPRCFT